MCAWARARRKKDRGWRGRLKGRRQTEKGRGKSMGDMKEVYARVHAADIDGQERG